MAHTDELLKRNLVALDIRWTVLSLHYRVLDIWACAQGYSPRGCCFGRTDKRYVGRGTSGRLPGAWVNLWRHD